ncbi:hypothetical protein D0Z00_002775 [Geotrichum galactomycetum]|uniref:Uncharacterized protein n=1 Tax=Geotrichum galactomycetum TaxID=27317 RepID=A0ACB6V322_9ASCO|nr:hypothetical protein D0Z00_002775 [Geotrichum candidum]
MQNTGITNGNISSEQLQRYQQLLARQEQLRRQQLQQQQQQQQAHLNNQNAIYSQIQKNGYPRTSGSNPVVSQQQQVPPRQPSRSYNPQQQQQHQHQHQQQQPNQLQPQQQQQMQQIPQPEPQAPNPVIDLKSLEPSTPDDILALIDELKTLDEPELDRLKSVIAADARDELEIQKSAQKFNSLLKRKRAELSYYNQIIPYRQSQPGAIFDGGYSGYGNSWTGGQFRVAYPRERKRNKRISRELNFSTTQTEEIADTPEMLVPIRLDLDLDKYRLHDTFTWNTNEKTVTVAQFAENLVEDFHFPLSVSTNVATAINEQLTDFHPHTFCDITGPKYAATTNFRDEDMRILIKLDITVGQHNLIDKFEWDINCPENSPEEFAEVLCQELNLSGEFCTAIAHAIREQQQLFTKSLLLVGHQFDGSPIADEDIRREFCPSVTTDFLRAKSHVKEFQPVLFQIDDNELDRQDKDRDRESRRKRRQGRAGRRGGPALPDFHELIRTFRTPVYSSMLPGAVDRNMDLFRKQEEQRTAQEEEDTTVGFVSSGASTAAGVAGSASGSPAPFAHTPPRRGRPSAAQLAANAAAGISHGRVGRPPLNRNADQSAQLRQQAVFRASLEQAHHHHPQHENQSLVVKLKVPRLREFLDQLSRTKFSTIA